MFELGKFIEAAQAAVQETEAQAAVREVLAEAMSAPSEVLNALGDPTDGGIFVLARSASLTILNMVWQPNMMLLPHDHTMWASIGIYTGREDNIFWKKVKGDPNGRIDAASAKAMGRGDVATLGKDLIHSVSNPIPRLTGALHIYGGDFFRDGRSQWDPETLHQAPLDMQAMRDEFAGVS